MARSDIEEVDVCIIGAGMSGLQCLRAVLQCGLKAVVLDKQNELGGVWNMAYHGLTVQVPKQFYQLAEFPSPSYMEQFPSGPSIKRYIQDYAEHFDLAPHVRRRCRVTKVAQRHDRKDWEVSYQVISVRRAMQPDGPVLTPTQLQPTKSDASQLHQQHSNIASELSSSMYSRPSPHVTRCIVADNASQQGSAVMRESDYGYQRQDTGQSGAHNTRSGTILARFVVVCTGLHSTPVIPDIPDRHLFKGEVVHSGQFNDLAATKGKHVVVVGGGKAAVDMACDIAINGQAASCTVVFRQAHWPVPREKAWGAKKQLFAEWANSRAPLELLPPYYTASKMEQLRHSLAKGSKTKFWRSMEAHLVQSQGLDETMRPNMQMEKDIFHGGIIHDGRWADLMSGRTQGLMAVKGEVVRYAAGGVFVKGVSNTGGFSAFEPLPAAVASTHTSGMMGARLASPQGSFLQADFMIFATGYHKKYTFFDTATQHKLDVQRDGMYLYRSMIPPAVPNLAFIGSEVDSFNNPLTAALQCAWFRHALQGQVVLPSTRDMAADCAAQAAWKRRVMPPQLHRSAALLLYMQAYHDQLVMDMGHMPVVKASGIACFGGVGAGVERPLTIDDYHELFLSKDSTVPSSNADTKLATMCASNCDEVQGRQTSDFSCRLTPPSRAAMSQDVGSLVITPPSSMMITDGGPMVVGGRPEPVHGVTVGLEDVSEGEGDSGEQEDRVVFGPLVGLTPSTTPIYTRGAATAVETAGQGVEAAVGAAKEQAALPLPPASSPAQAVSTPGKSKSSSQQTVKPISGTRSTLHASSTSGAASGCAEDDMFDPPSFRADANFVKLSTLPKEVLSSALLKPKPPSDNMLVVNGLDANPTLPVPKSLAVGKHRASIDAPELQERVRTAHTSLNKCRRSSVDVGAFEAAMVGGVERSEPSDEVAPELLVLQQRRSRRGSGGSVTRRMRRMSVPLHLAAAYVGSHLLGTREDCPQVHDPPSMSQTSASGRLANVHGLDTMEELDKDAPRRTPRQRLSAPGSDAPPQPEARGVRESVGFHRAYSTGLLVQSSTSRGYVLRNVSGASSGTSGASSMSKTSMWLKRMITGKEQQGGTQLPGLGVLRKMTISVSPGKKLPVSEPTMVKVVDKGCETTRGTWLDQPSEGGCLHPLRVANVSTPDVQMLAQAFPSVQAAQPQAEETQDAAQAPRPSEECDTVPVAKVCITSKGGQGDLKCDAPNPASQEHAEMAWVHAQRRAVALAAAEAAAAARVSCITSKGDGTPPNGGGRFLSAEDSAPASLARKDEVRRSTVAGQEEHSDTTTRDVCNVPDILTCPLPLATVLDSPRTSHDHAPRFPNTQPANNGMRVISDGATTIAGAPGSAPMSVLSTISTDQMQGAVAQPVDTATHQGLAQGVGEVAVAMAVETHAAGDSSTSSQALRLSMPLQAGVVSADAGDVRSSAQSMGSSLAVITSGSSSNKVVALPAATKAWAHVGLSTAMPIPLPQPPSWLTAAPCNSGAGAAFPLPISGLFRSPSSQTVASAASAAGAGAASASIKKRFPMARSRGNHSENGAPAHPTAPHKRRSMHSMSAAHGMQSMAGAQGEQEQGYGDEIHREDAGDRGSQCLLPPSLVQAPDAQRQGDADPHLPSGSTPHALAMVEDGQSLGRQSRVSHQGTAGACSSLTRQKSTGNLTAVPGNWIKRLARRASFSQGAPRPVVGSPSHLVDGREGSANSGRMPTIHQGVVCDLNGDGSFSPVATAACGPPEPPPPLPQHLRVYTAKDALTLSTADITISPVVSRGSEEAVLPSAPQPWLRRSTGDVERASCSVIGSMVNDRGWGAEQAHQSASDDHMEGDRYSHDWGVGTGGGVRHSLQPRMLQGGSLAAAGMGSAFSGGTFNTSCVSGLGTGGANVAPLLSADGLPPALTASWAGAEGGASGGVRPGPANRVDQYALRMQSGADATLRAFAHRLPSSGSGGLTSPVKNIKPRGRSTHFANAAALRGSLSGGNSGSRGHLASESGGSSPQLFSSGRLSGTVKDGK